MIDMNGYNIFCWFIIGNLMVLTYLSAHLAHQMLFGGDDDWKEAKEYLADPYRYCIEQPEPCGCGAGDTNLVPAGQECDYCN